MADRRGKNWIYLALAGLVALAIVMLTAAPSPAQISRSFPVDRLHTYQLTNLNWADEVALGEAIDRQLKQDGLRLYGGNFPINDYVNQVGQRVAAASHQAHRVYTFQVVDDPGINAFATLGGYIYIYTGLLQAMQNEAELAGVLAHEVGHIEQQDGLNQLWHQLTVHQLGQQLEGIHQRRVAFSGQLRSLSTSHADEYVADTIAFHILGRAGYAQAALVTLLQRMDQDFSEAVPIGFISSHPNPRRRVSQLQQRLAVEQNPLAMEGLDSDPYAARVAPLIDLSPVDHSAN
ncbi:MAG: M48 family metalloprotease [Leptolyngbyaceae cyanobacterium SM2_3_12]|nr:M48 family metalloprotease [Leptolyngbyaceae cyanobacterium SM2_3_12]